jgi:predicted unusual protein kinase regulating ubiquinone biosynthesis (AarF/ABC1/UbiB family)
VSAAAGADSLVSRPGQQAAMQIDLSTIARNLLYNHLHQVLNGKYAHCNPLPALLAVLEDNTIVYRDCRAVERLDSRFSQQQLEVISAARAGDVDSLFRSLWDWVEGPYDAPVEFEASFHRRVSEWLDAVEDRQTALSERSVRRLLAGIIDDFRRFQIAAPAALLAYYNAFAITTMTVEILAPDLDIDAELAGFFQQMLTERIERKIDTRTLSHTVLEYEQFLVALPHQFREFMRQVRQRQSPVVRTVDVWELRGWNLLQLLATLTILAIAAAWLWSQWNGAGFPGVRIPATVFITAICSLLILRRVCRLRYDQCAMGSRKMRRP